MKGHRVVIGLSKQIILISPDGQQRTPRVIASPFVASGYRIAPDGESSSRPGWLKWLLTLAGNRVK